MKLSKKASGLAGGIIWGFIIFAATIFLLLTGSQGQMISRIANIYLGYSFSYLGSLLGLLWGFLNGFIVGWFFAFLYNLFTKDSK